MNQLFAPLEAEAVEEDREHLEVIVLLVAHHIDHLVDGKVGEAHLGGANILGHIYAGAVRAQQQLLVEALVGEVGPYRVVIFAEEQALSQSLFHLLLAYEVGVRLVINLIEAHAQGLVGLVEASIHPVVHLCPQGAHLGVVVLPFHQHLVSLFHQGALSLGFLFGSLFGHALGHKLCLQGFHLFAVVLVKGYIVVANEVVALLAAGFGCFAIAPLLPCQHRLADVYAAVVHNVCLHHAVAVGLHNFC